MKERIVELIKYGFCGLLECTHIGDVLIKDVAGTGVDVVATRNVEAI